MVLYENLPTFCYTCGLVGHGSNSCSRTSVPSQDHAPPPPRILRGPTIEQRQDAGLTMGPENVPMPVDPGILPNDPRLISSDASLEKEFGAWLLVP